MNVKVIYLVNLIIVIPLLISANPEKILSRKRRYLIFPEGSSLQVVYDGIIPIVDYTDLFILGITCSLAWPLPNHPINFKEDINHKLETDGILFRKDNISNIKYIDIKPKSKAKTKIKLPNKKPDESSYGPNNYNKAPPTSNKYSYYFNPRYSSKRISNHIPNRTINRNTYSYSNQLYGQINTFATQAQKYKPWNNSKWNTYQRENYGKRRHYILPIFGRRRRSIGSAENHLNELTNEQKIFLEYHRKTRHDLYMKIEGYLNTHGKPGEDCLLKTLCETGQKQQDNEPGTFVGEIMRAIFSVPKTGNTVEHPKHREYDDAHSIIRNCEELFPKCKDSLWNSIFVM